MAKKALKKQSKIWECSKGCDVSKQPCKHLEKLLNTSQRSIMPGKVMIEGLRVNGAFEEDDSKGFEARCIALENKLQDIDVDPHSTLIFIDHIVGEVPIRQLAEDYGTEEHTIRKILEDVKQIVSKNRKVFGDSDVNE